MERLDRNDQFNSALKSIAHIEIHTSTGRYPLKAALMAKRPSSLRLETIPFIGPPDLLLAVCDDILKVFLPQKGEFYEGKATPKNLKYFFPFSTAGLQIDGMVSLLFGTYPKLPGKSITLAGFSEDSLYRIDILSESRKIQSLWFDTDKNNLVRVDLFSADNSRFLSARFAGHITKANTTIPQEILVVTGEDDTQKIMIRYTDIQMEPGVDTELFQLRPPPGVTSIYIDG
jgi:outer membrane lipoprotein-sorting protein